MNISNLFIKARKLSRDTHREGDVLKLGNLRAGNTGIMTTNGDVAGSCIRKAHLRSLGIELEDIEEDKLIMFDLGLANEEVITNKLKSVLPEGYMMLREEEIPIEWHTRNGNKVTGRPDIVICSLSDGPSGTDKDEPRPVLGLELKSVHSLWTARDVLFNGKPKLSNLAQAAHYMWKLDVPYKLIYTGYSQLGQGMAGTSEGWVAKLFPRPGDKMSEFLDYTYYEKKEKTVWDAKKKSEVTKLTNSKVTKEQWESLPYNMRDYGIKHITQFEIVYDMQFSLDGTVQYKREEDIGWKDTIINRDDIPRFFEAASVLPESSSLGPRPAQVDTNGDKAGYSDCAYCPLSATCDAHEQQGYSKWLQEVKKFSKVAMGK
jgi:hypothetical protein